MQANLKNVLDKQTFHKVQKSNRWPLDQRPENLDINQWLVLADFLFLDASNTEVKDMDG
jgi:hypothetical protein